MKQNPTLYIGTSGWQYDDWKGVFYPEGIKGKRLLPYYADHMRTVEVNSTFYRTPQPSSTKDWSEEVDSGFRFAIKANRYATHVKKMVLDDQLKQHLKVFTEAVNPLKAKLSCLLFQLPPSLKFAQTKLDAFAYIADYLRNNHNNDLDVAVEFRHHTWLNGETYEFLRSHQLANVINDSPYKWPCSLEVTSDISYIRFHGSRQLYRSNYNDQELKSWLDIIEKKCQRCQKVYCYFNNDYRARAAKNALRLKELAQERGLTVL